MKWAQRSAPWVVLLGLFGCADTGGKGQVAKQPYDSTFQYGVYPVLLRDCAFPTCHGSSDRFFRVYGPGRARLDSDEEALAIATLVEQGGAHSSALSMIDVNNPAASPLLQKPLAVAAGGAAHGGVDGYDRDVYRTTQDDGYRVLLRWVMTQPMPKPVDPTTPAQPAPANDGAPAPAAPAPGTLGSSGS